jgi:hypothetical protein
MLDRSRSRDRSKTGGAFSPAGLFVTGAQGAWYDPSDFSTLYQNSTGTTPVTAVEQPVGLMLDRSRGLVLGPELVVNGGFDSDVSGWSLRAGSDPVTGGALAWVDGVAQFTRGTTFPSTAASQSVGGFTIGRWYIFSGRARLVSGSGVASIQLRTSDGGGGSTLALSQDATTSTFTSCSFVWLATQTSAFVSLLLSANNAVGEFDAISIRELPGNHALQATSASRPVLRARYNLLTRSEEFDNAAWNKQRTTVTANAVTAPDGTTTADAVFETVDNGAHGVYQSITKAAFATTYAVSCYVKPNGRDWAILQLSGPGETNRVRVWFDLSGSGAVGSNVVVGTGFSFVSASIQALADGWYRCTTVITGDTSTTYTAFVRTATGDTVVNYTGDITKGLYIWGAQLLTAADEAATGGAYQRIAAATDYDTSNPVWRPYLAFDGTDDFMSLASAISITTDMTVLRGFGRSAAGIRSAGLGPASGTEPRDYFWQTTNIESYGLGATAQTLTADTATGYFVGTLRRSATDEFLRRNGTQISTRAAPAVSGSFTKLGDLSGNLNNGPIYGLIVLDRELTGSELTATEQWMAGKTGATLA